MNKEDVVVLVIFYTVKCIVPFIGDIDLLKVMQLTTRKRSPDGETGLGQPSKPKIQKHTVEDEHVKQTRKPKRESSDLNQERTVEQESENLKQKNNRSEIERRTLEEKERRTREEKERKRKQQEVFVEAVRKYKEPGSLKFSDAPKGIPNLGNTCYMNSLLQVLSWTPFLGQQLAQQLWKSIENNKRDLDFDNVPARLFFLIINTHKGCEATVYRNFPDAVLREARKHNDQFIGYRQQDSFEMFNTLIEGVEEEAKLLPLPPENIGTLTDVEVLTRKSPVLKLVGGQFLTVWYYESCKHVELTFQRFTSVSVPVPKSQTFPKDLWDNHLDEYMQQDEGRFKEFSEQQENFHQVSEITSKGKKKKNKRKNKNHRKGKDYPSEGTKDNKHFDIGNRQYNDTPNREPEAKYYKENPADNLSQHESKLKQVNKEGTKLGVRENDALFSSETSSTIDEYISGNTENPHNGNTDQDKHIDNGDKAPKEGDVPVGITETEMPEDGKPYENYDDDGETGNMDEQSRNLMFDKDGLPEDCEEANLDGHKRTAMSENNALSQEAKITQNKDGHDYIVSQNAEKSGSTENEILTGERQNDTAYSETYSRNENTDLNEKTGIFQNDKMDLGDHIINGNATPENDKIPDVITQVYKAEKPGEDKLKDVPDNGAKPETRMEQSETLPSMKPGTREDHDDANFNGQSERKEETETPLNQEGPGDNVSQHEDKLRSIEDITSETGNMKERSGNLMSMKPDDQSERKEETETPLNQEGPGDNLSHEDKLGSIADITSETGKMKERSGNLMFMKHDDQSERKQETEIPLNQEGPDDNLLHEDKLGSIEDITSETGKMKERSGNLMFMKHDDQSERKQETEIPLNHEGPDDNLLHEDKLGSIEDITSEEDRQNGMISPETVSKTINGKSVNLKDQNMNEANLKQDRNVTFAESMDRDKDAEIETRYQQTSSSFAVNTSASENQTKVAKTETFDDQTGRTTSDRGGTIEDENGFTETENYDIYDGYGMSENVGKPEDQTKYSKHLVERHKNAAPEAGEPAVLTAATETHGERVELDYHNVKATTSNGEIPKDHAEGLDTETAQESNVYLPPEECKISGDQVKKVEIVTPNIPSSCASLKGELPEQHTEVLQTGNHDNFSAALLHSGKPLDQTNISEIPNERQEKLALEESKSLEDPAGQADKYNYNENGPSIFMSEKDEESMEIAETDHFGNIGYPDSENIQSDGMYSANGPIQDGGEGERNDNSGFDTDTQPGNQPILPHQPLEMINECPTDLERGLCELTEEETWDECDIGCRICDSSSSEIRGKYHTHKKLLIIGLPPILVVHINKFEQDGFGGLKKINKAVTYPKYLNMAPFCSSALQKIEIGDQTVRTWFRLYGVVSHGGTIHGGHYTAYVRASHQNTPSLENNFLQTDWTDPERLQEDIKTFWEDSSPTHSMTRTEAPIDTEQEVWYHISDSMVSRSDERAATNDPNAYILMYERCC